MVYQLSDDPGIAEIEDVLARIQKSLDIDLVSDFRATLEYAEPMARVGEAVAEAMVKMSRADGDPEDMIGRSLRGVRFQLDDGTEHTLRLNHGPLEPIFPGHCHKGIWICNPFGKACIVIEIPWWCGPDDSPGDNTGDIVIF